MENDEREEERPQEDHAAHETEFGKTMQERIVRHLADAPGEFLGADAEYRRLAQHFQAVAPDLDALLARALRGRERSHAPGKEHEEQR